MAHNPDSFGVEHAICQFLRTVKAAVFLLEQWVAHSRAGAMSFDEIADEADDTLNTVQAANRELRGAIATGRESDSINHPPRIKSAG